MRLLTKIEVCFWLILSWTCPHFTAHAATISWANTGTDFPLGANWTGGLAPADSLVGDIAAFSTATPTNQPTLLLNRSVAGLQFVNGAGAFTLSGPGILSLGASGIVNSANSAQTLNAPLRLGLSTAFTTSLTGALAINGTVDTNGLVLTLNGNGTGASAVAGLISGAGSLAKSGTGSWTLSGANTFSGGVTLSTGTLSLGHNSALGTGALQLNGGTLSTTAARILTNAVTLGGNATIGGSQAITFQAPITLNGTRILTVSNTALTTLEAGLSESAPSAFAKAGAGSLLVKTAFGTTGATTLTAGSLTLDTGVALPASNFTFSTGTLALSGTFNRTIGTGAGQVQFGAGNIGFASYKGPLTVTFGGGEIWGSTPGFIQGGTLSLNTTSSDSVVTLGSNFSLGSATRTITVADNTTVTTDSALISGSLSGTGGLIKNGAGLLTLSGANSYTGSTQILTGSLSINSLGSLGAGPSALGNPATIANGTITLGSTTNAVTLTYTGAATTSNRALDLGGTTGGATINASGTGALTITGGVTATGAGIKTLTLTGTNADENGISGTISDNSATNKTSISKTGTGAWKLSGTSTYTGNTTLSAGTLIAGSDSAFGLGTLSITGAGTLRGDGTPRIVGNAISLGISGATIGGSSALNFTGTLTNILAGNPTLNITNTAGTTFTAINLSNSANSRTLTFANTADAFLTGLIANGGTSTAGGLIKTGAGKLTLSAANTYGGQTTLSAGTLRATTNASALGVGNLSLGGGTLELANDTGLGFVNTTTLTAASTIRIDRLTAGAGVTHTLGTLTTASFALDVLPGSLLSANTPYGLAFGATVLAGSPFSLKVANNGSATGTVTLGSLSNTAARGLTLTGPGTVLLSSGSGLLTSGTAVVINRGTLRLGATNALGATAVTAVTVNDTAGSAAWLDLNGSSQSVLSLTFGGAAATATSLNQVTTGAGTLTLGGNVTYTATNNPLGATISGQLALGASARTFSIADSTNAASDLDVSAIVSGTVGLTKTGAGRLTLSAANTYSGTTTVSAGTLRATNASALGTGALSLGTGTLELASDTGLTFTNTATLTAAATIKVDRLTAGPGVTLTLGALTTATTTLSIAPGSLVTTNTPYGLVFGSVSLVGAPLTLNVANNGSATGTVTLGSLSNSAARGLTLTGPGTVTLSSPAGPLTSGTPMVINQGTLRLSASDALGSSALAAITVNDLFGATASLDLSGMTQTVFSVTLGGMGATPTSANTVSTGPGGMLTLGGNVTTSATGNPQSASISGNLALGAATRTFTIGDSINATTDLLTSAIISGTGGLTKAGAGRLDLTAANTYTGVTTLSAGTLGIGNNSALGTNSLTLTTGTMIAVGGARTLANNLVLSSGSSIAFSGPDSLSFNGNATFTGTDTITNSTTVTLVGTVSGSGSLVLAGSGTMILGGSNTYTGTTKINGGILRASNAAGSATGTGAITVGPAGTIAGTGRVTGALTLNGSISPGGAAGSGPGLLSTGSETWNGAAHYLWDITNATGVAGVGWDKISLTGGLTIAATNVSRFVIDLTSLTLANSPGNAANFSGGSNYSWVIASVTGAISGFTGDKFTVNAANFTNPHPGTFSVSVSGSNVLLTYTAVPETALWGVTASLGIFMLILLRRRRA